MPLLMEDFSQSAGQAGLLMSVFAITGLFLAIPSGFILQRLGYRATGLMALAFLAAGAGSGAFSKGIGSLAVKPACRRRRPEPHGSHGAGHYSPMVCSGKER